MEFCCTVGSTGVPRSIDTSICGMNHVSDAANYGRTETHEIFHSLRERRFLSIVLAPCYLHTVHYFGNSLVTGNPFFPINFHFVRRPRRMQDVTELPYSLQIRRLFHLVENLQNRISRVSIRWGYYKAAVRNCVIRGGDIELSDVFPLVRIPGWDLAEVPEIRIIKSGSVRNGGYV